MDPAAPFEPAAPLERTAPLEPAARRPAAWRQVGAIFLVHAVAGIVAGLIWRAWSPTTVAYLVAGSPGKGGAANTVLIPDESESQVAVDGRFFLLCAVIGLLAAIAVWQLRRLRGPLGLITLAMASLIGSVITWQVGSLLATGHRSGAINTAIRLPLTLHATSLLGAQALIAVVVYLLHAGLSSDETLMTQPEQALESVPVL